ncbi:MAG: GNAT family N-acetyltransferase [Clostridia bacterium]|nr:GNAT family N-acetyltransferase [Clostridia bacterium]
MELYRVTGESPAWQRIAYDYIRTDAFVVGQGIPVEREFEGDGPAEELEAVLLVEDHKPVAGLRIVYPRGEFAQIQRVATVREKQRGGYGSILMKEAEKWIAEKGFQRILITSQDRSVGFYEANGYRRLPQETLDQYFPEDAERRRRREEERKKNPDAFPKLGFSIILVEKILEV